MAAHITRSTELPTVASLRGGQMRWDLPKHVHHFQLASIEIERSRQERERVAALERVARIEQRIAELDERIRRHQRALGVKRDERRQDGLAGQTRGWSWEKRRILRY